MDIYKTELFPYLEGDMLNGKTFTLTMTTVKIEQLPTHNGKMETKYTIYFKETDKGLVLNKTNAKRIIALYSKETDEWTGERISLYAERGRAFGEDYNGVRVKETAPPVAQAKPSQAVAEPPPETAEPSPMDEVEEAERLARASAESLEAFDPEAQLSLIEQAETTAPNPYYDGEA